MPSPPVIFDTNRLLVGDSPYGDPDDLRITTWGKTRCAAIIDPAPYLGNFGYSVGDNSLIIDEGFHPDECYLFRVDRWPYMAQWTDGSSNTIDGYYGPHLGFTDGGIPLDSWISIGGFNVPDDTNTNAVGYTPYDNFLDENDCANFWEGRLVNTAYTTNNDFCNSDRATNPNVNGQALGAIGGFGSYSSISDMTQF